LGGGKVSLRKDEVLLANRASLNILPHMFAFPLINFTFLIILYRIHRRIFWITTLIESVLYIGGTYWIYTTFESGYNHSLYLLALTGIGFIIVFIAFFVAIFANHHNQES